MKKYCFIWLLFIVFFISVLPVYADQQSQTSNSGSTTSDTVPYAYAKNPRFEFVPVIEDTIITHEFIIENKGKAPLVIEKVKTSCGCTTASYTKTIEPGAEGSINIKGNTKGYGGRTFSKTITVYTNDPKHQQINLYIYGIIEPFALIEPKTVFLSGFAGTPILSTVIITPLEKYPFNIIQSTKGENLEKKISFTLEKKDNKYILAVKNLLNEKNRYSGRIYLKTDSLIKPEIVINVIGMIKDKKQ